MVGRSIEFTDGTVLGFLNANSTKLDIGTITSHQIQFYEGGDARMVISGSGKVGIGETSPDEMLHLTSGTSIKPQLKIENTNTNNLGGYLGFYKTANSAADGDEIGNIYFESKNASNSAQSYAKIVGGSSDVTAGDEAGYIAMRTWVDAAEKEMLTIRGYNGSVVGQAEIVLNEDSLDCDLRVE